MTNDTAEAKKLEALLKQLDSSDAQMAWQAFLEAYADTIFQIVSVLERDPDHRGDSFLYVCEHLSRNRFRRLRRFRSDGPASFSTWLRAVVRNLYLDWIIQILKQRV